MMGAVGSKTMFEESGAKALHGAVAGSSELAKAGAQTWSLLSQCDSFQRLNVLHRWATTCYFQKGTRQPRKTRTLAEVP